MLDRDGFRPNVGIVLLNQRNQVFWGKRIRTHSWQFPQGGINYGETPEQAMYRELQEEVGLLPEHVRIVARTGAMSAARAPGWQRPKATRSGTSKFPAPDLRGRRQAI